MTTEHTDPEAAAAAGLFELATGHYRSRRPEEAERICRELLLACPGHVPARHLLGVLLLQRGQAGEAAGLLEQAAAGAPDNARYLYNLGLAYQGQARQGKAMQAFRQVLARQPAFPEALLALGRLCEQAGQGDEAIDCYRRARALQPDSQQVLELLAGAWHRAGRLEQAMECYRALLAIDPENADALNGMGAIHYSIRDYSGAVASYRCALRVRPESVDTLNNLGDACQAMGDTPAARESYRQALALQPGNSLWALRLAGLCPAVADSLEEIGGYRDSLAGELERQAAAGLSATPEDIMQAGVYPSYSLMYHGRDDRPLREAYARVLAPCFPAMPAAQSTGRRRIGLVVTRMHEGIFLRSLRGVLQRMDPGAFELVVICQQEGEAKIRGRLGGDRIQVLVMPERIDAVVELLRRERFDILYYWEVATDVLNYCLPFYRLAPIQCTSWGIQVTTGIANMDYYLSSRLVEPVGAPAHYTEQLLCADTLLTYQYRMELSESAKRREDFGFGSRQHLYLFPQQVGKFHPDFDAVVAGILRRDPQGLLVILSDRWEYNAGRLRDRLQRCAGDVMERIRFLPRLEHADYLGLVAAADVLLDPPGYGGVNSSYDGFSLGKPVVTVESGYHIGRYTAGCYRKMGLPEYIAPSLDGYADMAVRLGTEPDWHEHVCARIREAGELLFEDLQAVREHERLFNELLETL